ncbi:MAG: sulfite exporter TauE/SafE family protein [Thermodesulfobacteriota bacterium]
MDFQTNEVLRLALYLGAGFCSGFLNTIASAGSAIVLPLLVFMGLPANIANGTNRVQIVIGRISSVVAFQRKRAIDWRNALTLSVPGVLGGIAGASLAANIQSRYVGWAITVAIVATLAVLLANPKRLLEKQALAPPVIRWWHLALYFGVGFWAGFIVLNASTYALLVLVLAVGYDLKKANAIKAVANLPMSLASLVVFAWYREIDWTAGLLLSVGSMAGSWISAGLATKEWIKVWIYRLLVLILVFDACDLFSRYFLDLKLLERYF